MKHGNGRRLLKHLSRLLHLPHLRRAQWLTLVLMLGLLSALVISSIASCRPGEPVKPDPPAGRGGMFEPPPAKHPGLKQLPTSLVNIRVKLTARPIESAQAGSTGACEFRVDGRGAGSSPSAISAAPLRRRDGQWVFQGKSYAGRILEMSAGASALVQFGADHYRGVLRFLPAEGDSFIAINEVDMESYLSGVLAKELWPNWQPETYRALAIAARTYAYYQSQAFGTDNAYDVANDQSSQCYGGYSAETAKSRQAVNSTRGLMLAIDTAQGVQTFRSEYSSCCGGTVNAAAVLRDSPAIAPFAGGQKCDDCSSASRYRWPTVKVSKAEVYRAMMQAYPSLAAALGQVTDVRVVAGTAYGRIMWLDIVGKEGVAPIRLRADDLRLVLMRAKAANSEKIYSMNCQVRSAGNWIEFSAGKGFGHGVGICQHGAEGKALKGWKAEQIVAFYYPGAKLARTW